MQKILFGLLIFGFNYCAASTVTINQNANTFLVTAATGAFGECICNSIAEKGYDLIITGRNQKKLDELQKRLKSQHPLVSVQSLIIDFSDTLTIHLAAKKLERKSISGIVLIGPRPVLTKDGIPTKEEWSQVFLETFINPLEVISAFSPFIKENASIIVISGNSSKNYLPGYPNTNVIRLAWSGEIKNLAHYYGKRKIRVNAISPGPILTQFHIDRIKEKAFSNNISFEEQAAKNASSIPLGAYGKPDDVANLVLFLLSSKSAHLNGINIVLDGGESLAY